MTALEAVRHFLTATVGVCSIKLSRDESGAVTVALEGPPRKTREQITESFEVEELLWGDSHVEQDGDEARLVKEPLWARSASGALITDSDGLPIQACGLRTEFRTVFVEETAPGFVREFVADVSDDVSDDVDPILVGDTGAPSATGGIEHDDPPHPLSSFSVKELKQYAKANGISLTGAKKKPAILKRIQEESAHG